MDLLALPERMVQKDQLDQKDTLEKQVNLVNLVLEEKGEKLVIVGHQGLLEKTDLMDLRESQEV